MKQAHAFCGTQPAGVCHGQQQVHAVLSGTCILVLITL